MNTDKNRDLAAAEQELFQANRELGRHAFEVAIAPKFPEYPELSYIGTSADEPHLIYRGNESFLIVETEICDPGEENLVVQFELPDGRRVERGTREYLIAGLQVAGQRTMNQSLFTEIMSALSQERVRYILVSVLIGENAGKREVDSLELAEFDI